MECIICSKEFVKNTNNQICCSEECKIKRRIWRDYKKQRKNITKKCLECGKEFIAIGNAKRCSNECIKKHRKRMNSKEYKYMHMDIENKKRWDKNNYETNKEKIKSKSLEYYKKTKSDKKLHKCYVCGNEYMKLKRTIKKHTHSFCSVKCRRIWFKENKSGEKCILWKGGITPLHNEIRNSRENYDWIRSVFIRDGFKCKKCGSGRSISAHHINNFNKLYLNMDKQLRDTNNGITLCKSCHETFHKEYGRHDNNIEQINLFIKS